MAKTIKKAVEKITKKVKGVFIDVPVVEKPQEKEIHPNELRAMKLAEMFVKSLPKEDSQEE